MIVNETRGYGITSYRATNTAREDTVTIPQS
jgi:hypothetical protein